MIFEIVHGEGWWIVGWLTGIDKDLVCAVPYVNTRAKERLAQSPACKNLPLAIIGFLLKYLLLKNDINYSTL